MKKSKNNVFKDCWKDNEPHFAPLREILPEKYHEKVVPFVLDLKANICFKKCPVKKIGNVIYIFSENRDSMIVFNPSPEIAVKFEIFAWNEDRTYYRGGGQIYYKNGEISDFDTCGEKDPYEDL